MTAVHQTPVPPEYLPYPQEVLDERYTKLRALIGDDIKLIEPDCFASDDYFRRCQQAKKVRRLLFYCWMFSGERKFGNAFHRDGDGSCHYVFSKQCACFGLVNRIPRHDDIWSRNNKFEIRPYNSNICIKCRPLHTEELTIDDLAQTIPFTHQPGNFFERVAKTIKQQSAISLLESQMMLTIHLESLGPYIRDFDSEYEKLFSSA